VNNDQYIQVEDLFGLLSVYGLPFANIDSTSIFDAGYVNGGVTVQDTVFIPETADLVFVQIGGGYGHLALPNSNSFKTILIVQEGPTGGNLDIMGHEHPGITDYMQIVSGGWQGIGIAIRNREGFWRVLDL
jgi:hypothetical protein